MAGRPAKKNDAGPSPSETVEAPKEAPAAKVEPKPTAAVAKAVEAVGRNLSLAEAIAIDKAQRKAAAEKVAKLRAENPEVAKLLDDFEERKRNFDTAAASRAMTAIVRPPGSGAS